jgi:hypothetical protein
MKNTGMRFPLILVLGLMAFACGANQPDSSRLVSSSNKILLKNKARVIHVFVALCDNVNQGIVKVPAAIGNGQDAAGNLYWGAAYGVKSYFKKQSDWILLKSGKQSKEILDRCVFKHKTANVYLVADAYDGALIKKATVDFLKSCAGSYSDSVLLKEEKLYIGGSSNLLSFIGHDGLMDFDLDAKFKRADTLKRESIILACISKRYFTPYIKTTGAIPLLWSTGLMSPEAYTLKAAIDGWIKNESAEQIRTRAAGAYHQYQKCGIKGARNLLVTGW